MRTIATACRTAILWVFLTAWASAQQDVQWASDLESAKQAAAASNRLVLMHFSATWCHWCKPLEKNVFGQPEAVAAIEASYVAVRMDFDKHRQIAKQYGVRFVPWDVVITPDGYWVEDFNSPQTARDYAARVNKIATREAAKRNAQFAANQPAPVQPAAAPMVAQPGLAGPTDSAPRPQENASRRLTDDRYADFFSGQQQPQEPRRDPVAGPYAQQVAPPAGPPSAQIGQPNPPGNAAIGGPVLPPEQPQPSPGVPSGQPTFGLDGHCPVHLLEQNAWVSGDRRWGLEHRGRIYLFTSEQCLQKFRANPDRYAPALSGHDPVALVDRGQTVPGRREYGCFFGVEPNKRVVLFADEGSYQTFSRNPQRYAGQIFAAQPR
jgi:YHS domain-containing protein